ncbi:MAG: hypothetical protein MMC33_010676 [Icmadophila ericetorum]|nr:hypothetical protein [Icmadophila ericetorum]
MDGDWDLKSWKPTGKVVNIWRKLGIQGTPPSEMIEMRSVNVQECTKEITRLPHDLDAWLIRATSLSELGYIDLAAVDYYKTLKLAQIALDPEQASNPISFSARFIVGMLMLLENGPGWNIAKNMDQKIAGIEFACCINLIHILEDFTAFWDACRVCEEFNATVSKRPQWKSDPNWGLPGQAEFYKRYPAKLLHITDEIEIEGRRGGMVILRKWPWMKSFRFVRDKALLNEINAELKVCSGMIEVRKSSMEYGISSAKTKKQKKKADESLDFLGIFAKKDIGIGETFLVDRPLFATSSVVTPQQCCHCFENLPSTRVVSCANCITKYCSSKCMMEAQNTYHKPLCGRDFSWVHYRYSPDMSKTNGILLKLLASSIQNGIHPLEHPLIVRLTANYTGDNTDTWSLANVANQIKMVEQLGIDVYADLRFDTWVLGVIGARISNNAIGGNDRLIVRPHHSLFNRSCETYTDMRPIGGVGKSLEMEMVAVRPIKKGEEIFIEYFDCEDLPRALR